MVQSPEGPNFATYFELITKATGCRARAGTVEPDIAPLWIEAAETAESLAAPHASNPQVQDETLKQGLTLVPALKQLAEARGLVEEELVAPKSYDERSRPYLDRIGPAVWLILKEEVTDPRAATIMNAARAAGAISLAAEAEVVPTAPEVEISQVTEQPAAEAAHPADHSETEGTTDYFEGVETADQEPGGVLPMDEVRRQLHEHIRTMGRGSKFSPRDLRLQLFGEGQANTLRNQALRVYQDLVKMGVLVHSGKVGYGSVYTVVAPAKMPVPQMVSNPLIPENRGDAVGSEEHGVEARFDMKDALLLASILERFKEDIQELGLPPPLQELLDAVFGRINSEMPVDEADRRYEQRQSLMRIEKILKAEITDLSSMKGRLAESDPRSALITYLRIVLNDRDSRSRFQSFIEEERDTIVGMRRSVVIGDGGTATVVWQDPPRARAARENPSAVASLSRIKTTEEVLAAVNADEPTLSSLRGCLARAEALVGIARSKELDLKTRYGQLRLANDLGGLPHIKQKFDIAARAKLLPAVKAADSVTVKDMILAELLADPNYSQVVLSRHPVVRRLIEIVINGNA